MSDVFGPSPYGDQSLPEIRVPGSRSLGDYANAVNSLIHDFAKVSGKTPRAVFRSLAAADCDCIYFRMRGTEKKSSGKVFDKKEMTAFVNGAGDMITCALCDMSYDGSSGKLSWRFENDPGPGVTAITPPVDEKTMGFRRLTIRFAQALSRARIIARRIESENDLSPADILQEAVSAGLSANFFDSLAGMLDAQEETCSVEIEVAGAPIKPEDGVNFCERFESGESGLFYKASHFLDTHRDQCREMDSLDSLIETVRVGEMLRTSSPSQPLNPA